jgi:hypothetical protein
MQDKFEDAKQYTPWVDITRGMVALEHLDYEQGTWGWPLLLDPSNPDALNSNKEQSFKSLGTLGTNASMYTTMHSVSLGSTASEPQDKDEVDSKESDIFKIGDTGTYVRMSDCLQGIEPCKCKEKGHQFQRLCW